jgi:hypothetical protein
MSGSAIGLSATGARRVCYLVLCLSAAMLLRVPNEEPQARCITSLGPKRDAGLERASHPSMRRPTAPSRLRINVTGDAELSIRGETSSAGQPACRPSCDGLWVLRLRLFDARPRSFILAFGSVHSATNAPEPLPSEPWASLMALPESCSANQTAFFENHFRRAAELLERAGY